MTGAYRIRTERLTDTRDIHRVVMDIDVELFARRDIKRLGIAPFSSMFWYGEHSRTQAADWRPEIHDRTGSRSGPAAASASGARSTTPRAS